MPPRYPRQPPDTVTVDRAYAYEHEAIDEVLDWLRDHDLDPDEVACLLMAKDAATVRAKVWLRDADGRRYFDEATNDAAHRMVDVTPTRPVPVPTPWSDGP